MSLSSVWVPPAAAITFLAVFAATVWPMQYRSSKDKGKTTQQHSERVYRVFEFFVTVSLAIVAGLGYLRLGASAGAAEPSATIRQGMTGLGMLELAVATTLSLFVIIHQGSKLRRWQDAEWEKLPFWLELWMCISMMAIGTSVWVVSYFW